MIFDAHIKNRKWPIPATSFTDRSSQVTFECPSDRVLKCLSAKVPWVFESLNAHGMPECSWSALWVPSFPLSALRVKKVWIITRNGLVDNFNFFSECILLHNICFFFLGNKMYKFYQILLARCNHSKGFQKLSLNIL